MSGGPGAQPDDGIGRGRVRRGAPLVGLADSR
jgi:hypothetical protein